MSGRLIITPVTTEIFRIGENLEEFVARHISSDLIAEGMVLAVTSKIVSLAEQRLVPKDSIDKQALVRQNADVMLGETVFGLHLTVKDGLLIPSAGIDESNSETGDYILYPADPFASAAALWRGLRSRWELKDLGILLTDSHVAPLRRGVTGVSLAYYGFHAVQNMIGTADLFGKPLQVTQVNLADAWSAAAVVMMGEGSECRPLAVIGGAAPEFADTGSAAELSMPIAEDLYAPLLMAAMAQAK